MRPLHDLAQNVGVDERTLRRAVERGLVRAHRQSPRRLQLAAGERRYVARQWPTLAALLRSVRTRRNVRLAVLYGSVARGDDDACSDVDLLVRLADVDGLGTTRLARSLRERLGREVQIVLYEDALDAPLLLADILRDGRVLVDRDAAWPALLDARAAVEADAADADASVTSEIGRLADWLRTT